MSLGFTVVSSALVSGVLPNDWMVLFGFHRILDFTKGLGFYL